MGVLYKWDGKTTIQTTRKRLRKSASRKRKRGQNTIPRAWGRIGKITRLCPEMRQANENKEKIQHTTLHHQLYNGLATHQDKQDIFHVKSRAGKNGTETYPNTIHSMQPQQFTVKARWTQLLSPSRPGTFLPCVWSPSSVFDKQVFYTSSTAAVVSLSCPLGGDWQTTHQQKQAKHLQIQHHERKRNTNWKRKMINKAQARYPTPQTGLLSQEGKQSVCYIAFSRFSPPVHIQHILCTCLFFIREKTCGHNTSQRYYIVMLST